MEQALPRIKAKLLQECQPGTSVVSVGVNVMLPRAVHAHYMSLVIKTDLSLILVHAACEQFQFKDWVVSELVEASGVKAYIHVL